MNEISITRTVIKQNIAQRIRTAFSAEAGLEGQWFRKTLLRQWAPGNPIRPACWVTDYGCRRNETGNSDETKTRILTVQLVLDLDANWKKEEAVSDWSDRVERLCLNLQNFHAGPGVYRCDYISDDPFDAVLQDGTVEAIWLAEFEIEYQVEVPKFGREDE